MRAQAQTLQLSVREKLSQELYKTKIEYPTKPVRPSTKLDLAIATDAQIASTRQAVRDYETAMAAYQENLKRFREDVARLEAEFRVDLEREAGMSGHLKADLLYSKAWERGHSSGLYDVCEVYCDLVELVR